MTCDELVRSLDTPNKAEWRATVHELLTSLPVSRSALLDGLLSERPMVRAGCAAALDHTEQDVVVEAALRRAGRDHDARVRDKALHSLACAHCKPDGCLVDDSLAVLIDAMLHDPSIRIRRKMAGGLMHSHHRRTAEVTAAFAKILAEDSDRVLRHRAAIYMASTDVPRTERRRHEDWRRWEARVVEFEARIP